MSKQTATEWLFKKLWDEPKDKLTWYAILDKAKEMEKQQMCEFAEYVATYPDKNRNVNGEMLHAKSKYDGAERTIDLLEQYYNETFKK
jgi:hypothetical protein